MATQVIGAMRRLRMRAVLVALALSLAVVVLAAQASSIRSTTSVSHDPPVPAHVDPHPRIDDSPGGSARNRVFHRPAPWEIARKR